MSAYVRLRSEWDWSTVWAGSTQSFTQSPTNPCPGALGRTDHCHLPCCLGTAQGSLPLLEFPLAPHSFSIMEGPHSSFRFPGNCHQDLQSLSQVYKTVTNAKWKLFHSPLWRELKRCKELCLFWGSSSSWLLTDICARHLEVLIYKT